MRIYGFQGFRYADHLQAGPLAGPPYDQIDSDLQRRLHREPRHFAHLIRPAATDGDPHRAAAALHAQWLESGILVRDEEPTLYPYEIELAQGGRRLGICALVGIEVADSGVVRPHEATMTKTVAERLSLLRATRIDLEPILMLADDGGLINTLLEQDLQGLEPLISHTDDAGHRHLLYRIVDAGRVAEYQQALVSKVGLIADGHHRYTVASQYATETDATPDTAPAAKLAVITSLTSPGLQIDPIHRRLGRQVDIERVRHLSSAQRPLAAASGTEIAGEVAAAPQPGLGVSRGTATEVWSFDATAPPADLADHLHHLSVGWLHDLLLPGMGLQESATTDGTVTYRSDPDRLHQELSAGDAEVGFWLPPMSGEDFARAMEGGRLLPPKSTRFLPKVASGLVWAGHDSLLATD